MADSVLLKEVLHFSGWVEIGIPGKKTEQKQKNKTCPFYERNLRCMLQIGSYASSDSLKSFQSV